MTKGKNKAAREREISVCVRDRLVAMWPKLFAARNKPRVPLAIGVDKIILQAMPELKRQDLKTCLKHYVTRPKYLRTLVAGASRYGPWGPTEDKVTVEQQERARAQLIRMAARAEAQKDAKKCGH